MSTWKVKVENPAGWIEDVFDGVGDWDNASVYEAVAQAISKAEKHGLDVETQAFTITVVASESAAAGPGWE